jgi:hypothetical protein
VVRTGQREDEVGDDDDFRRPGDESGVTAAMRHQHEGDAHAGAEDHDGAEHVQIFDEEIERHRCPIAGDA